jgi:hypothetical protein
MSVGYRCAECGEPVVLQPSGSGTGIFVHEASGRYWSSSPVKHHVKLRPEEPKPEQTSLLDPTA